MSWLVRESGLGAQRGDVEDVLSELRGRRAGGRGATGSVPRSQALRLSATWACLRLRADIVSTLTLEAFRRVGGFQVSQALPPVLLNPEGDEFGIEDWLYRSQYDLDSFGNTMGLIEELDGANRPAVIKLWSAGDCAVGERTSKSGKREAYYKHRGVEYDPRFVWHERQYPIAGSPIGMSPIAHAALAMQPALSASQFAATWFGATAGTPAQHLRNTRKTLDKKQARATKRRFESDIEDGGLFVSGNDWELKVLGAKASESMFLEQQKATPTDVCRFLGVPGDMIDAESSTGTITYANITQRNLQLLILNMNPALKRRESRFSARLLPVGRYAQFKRSELLAMDLKSRLEAYKIGIDARIYTPDEVRVDSEGKAPLTPEDEAQFKRLFGTKNPTPTPAPDPAMNPGGTTS